MNFNVENILNVRSKNHGHKPVNQGSTMIKIMVTRESQITAQIVLNNHKLQLPYATYMSLFQRLLNNPNGPTEEPRGMNLLTKFQPDPTVEEIAAAIRKFPSSKETLKTLLQCEMNFSLLKQLLQDPNGQIEVTQSMNLFSPIQR